MRRKLGCEMKSNVILCEALTWLAHGTGLPRVGDPSVMLIQGWPRRQRGSRDQNLWCGGSVAQG
jgi:hypothetical protein